MCSILKAEQHFSELFFAHGKTTITLLDIKYCKLSSGYMSGRWCTVTFYCVNKILILFLHCFSDEVAGSSFKLTALFTHSSNSTHFIFSLVCSPDIICNLLNCSYQLVCFFYILLANFLSLFLVLYFKKFTFDNTVNALVFIRFCFIIIF